MSDHEKKSTGLSTMDFMSMPVPMRRVIQIMLKKPEISYSELVALIEDMPESKRMSHKELDETLDGLIEKEWVVKEDAADPIYKISLGQKTGSDESRSAQAAPETTRTRKREGPVIKDLWDAVDTTEPESDYRKDMKEPQREQTPPESVEKQKEPPQKKKGFFQRLFGSRD